MIYGLLIENQATGYLSVRTYESEFLRALEMIMLADQPVILRCVEWAA